MALFQRITRDNQLVDFTRQEPVAASDEGGFVRLIIGLGNIGKEYEGTRHNIGFEVVDAYAKANKFSRWQDKPKFKAVLTEQFMAGKKVILAKPQTFMNESGQAIRAIMDFYKISSRDVTIIHDELDLPFGTVKTKFSGGSAGNNGIKSTISHIGEQFHRVRFGIKNNQLEKMNPADFVLAKFSATEKKQLKALVQTALEQL